MGIMFKHLSLFTLLLVFTSQLFSQETAFDNHLINTLRSPVLESLQAIEPKLDATIDFAQKNHPTFQEWKKSCDLLVDNPTCMKSALLTDELFDDILTVFSQTNEKELHNIFWVNDEKPTQDFYEKISNTNRPLYCPHVQKLMVPANNIVLLHGDIHGDIFSLNAVLTHLGQKGDFDEKDNFKLVNPQLKLFFLGDYTDRGRFGAEVIYTLLRLKTQNPQHVFLVRGNHEDIDLNKNDFAAEVQAKFRSKGFTLLKKINGMYQRLPIAIYLGVEGKNDYALCCHGGIEWGYNPHNLLATKHYHAADWIKKLDRICNIEDLTVVYDAITKELSKHNKYLYYKNEFKDGLTPSSPQTDTTNGFMWFDFFPIKDTTNAHIEFDPKRSWKLGQTVTKSIMKKYNIKCIFRAHQHGDPAMMNLILNNNNSLPPADKGVGKLWETEGLKAGELKEGQVMTFCVSPGLQANSRFGSLHNYIFDSFGMLQVASEFKDWRLDMHRINMIDNLLDVNEPVKEF